MREIKFRAWDIDMQIMIQPEDGDFIKWHAMSNWRQCLIVEQFTGLLDKNGIEIYEGDVLRCGIGKKTVVYSDDIGCFEAVGKTSARTVYGYTTDKTGVEIIGTIHDGDTP
jgi:hypothetical protein